MIPAGSVGLVAPPDGFAGLPGRIIAQRLGVPYSHSVIALGDGRVWDSTFPWSKVRSESYWAGRTAWWAPAEPLTEEQGRVLRSAARFTEGRVQYDVGALLSFIVRGVPGGRGHRLFCSYGVAELHMVARDYDFSGIGKPWLVTPYTLFVRMRGPDWCAL